MFVGIVGPGRLGRSFAVLLSRAGHRVALVRHVQPPDDVDVVLLTVPDQAIAAASAALPPGHVVLHCSGATDLSPLQTHRHHGSLHPIMTFPGPELALPDLDGVVAAIDGGDVALAIAQELAESLGMRAVRVPGDRRLYHAAAVLAGNGATMLLAEGVRLLIAAGAPPEEAASMLAPLAMRSVLNAPPDPLATLTGPVARGDLSVIEQHVRAMHEAGLGDVAELHRILADHALRGIAARKTQND